MVLPDEPCSRARRVIWDIPARSAACLAVILRRNRASLSRSPRSASRRSVAGRSGAVFLAMLLFLHLSEVSARIIALHRRHSSAIILVILTPRYQFNCTFTQPSWTDAFPDHKKKRGRIYLLQRKI